MKIKGNDLLSDQLNIKEPIDKSSISAGGHDGNGGDTVAVENGRQLLDLAEKNELQYFVPKLNYGSDIITKGMASLIASANMCAGPLMKQFCSR